MDIASAMMHACKCAANGGAPPPAPAGMPAAKWAMVVAGLRKVFGAGHLNDGFAGCTLDQVHPERGPDGCSIEGKYCRTPQTNRVTGDGGDPFTFQVVTQDRGYLREMVATDAVTGSLVVTQIDSIAVRGKEFLPNGPVISSAFGPNFQNYSLPGGILTKSERQVTVSGQFLGLSTGHATDLTIWVDEVR